MDYCCRYSENEIHFNLMALISDRRVQYEKRIAELTKTVEVSSILVYFVAAMTPKILFAISGSAV